MVSIAKLFSFIVSQSLEYVMNFEGFFEGREGIHEVFATISHFPSPIAFCFPTPICSLSFLYLSGWCLRITNSSQFFPDFCCFSTENPTSLDTLYPNPLAGKLGQFVIFLVKSFFSGWGHSEDNGTFQSLWWQGIIREGYFPKPWSEYSRKSINLPGEQGHS